MGKRNKRAQQLRVWHIPQIPGKAFRVEVASIEQAVLVLNAIAAYDVFQLANNIKPDYANAQGLEVFEKGEWVEWNDEDGDDINAYKYAGS